MPLKKNTSPKIKKLPIKFTVNTIMAGGIDCTFHIGKKQFDILFSEIFDPLSDIKAWLEAVSVGVYRASCKCIADGSKIYLSFEKLNEDEGIFILREVYEDEFIAPIHIQAIVLRKEMTQIIYEEFTQFFASQKYQPIEWERYTYEDIICEQFDMKSNQIIDELLRYSKIELENIFKNICPKDKHPSKCIQISDTYESMEDQEKIQQLQEVLAINFHPFYGMKTKDFKSEIIEKYINTK